MTGLPIPETFVSCTTLPAISWLPWSACAYTDPMAVFRFWLAGDTAIEYQQTELQPHEISRAQRYHRLEDRGRFVYTRRILRVLVGKYIAQNPHEISFTTGINNKPAIKDTTDWHMNVSHSGNWIVVAIGTVSVGVDVEKILPDFAFQELLVPSFSQEEQQFIAAGPDPRSLFYQLWTRKEALVKATAKGLDDDFFRIPSLDGVHAIGSDLIGATGGWMVRSFMAFEGYPAAVAYRTLAEIPKFYTLDSGLFGHSES